MAASDAEAEADGDAPADELADGDADSPAEAPELLVSALPPQAVTARASTSMSNRTSGDFLVFNVVSPLYIF